VALRILNNLLGKDYLEIILLGQKIPGNGFLKAFLKAGIIPFLIKTSPSGPKT